MTNIQLSDEATKKIEAVIGTSDPKSMEAFLERLADQEQLLHAALIGEPTVGDLHAIREGIADYEAGRVRPLAEFDKEFRDEMGFAPRTDA